VKTKLATSSAPRFHASRGSGELSDDHAVRSALLGALESRPEEHPRRLIQEFWIPVSHERADVVEVNGLLTGFEIKSGRDSLARLPRQVAAFSAVFDHMSLVCDRRHLVAAEDVIPSWWGLVRAEGAEGTVILQRVREPARNPAPEVEMRLRLLWKAELAAALRALGLRPGRLDRGQMRQTLMDHASTTELDSTVRLALLRRPSSARRW
jgi:hypothetical protein